MKICRNCGGELTDEAAFCPICATTVSPPSVAQPVEKRSEPIEPPVNEIPPEQPVIREVVYEPVISELPPSSPQTNIVQQPAINNYLKQKSSVPSAPQHSKPVMRQSAVGNYLKQQSSLSKTPSHQQINTTATAMVSELSKMMRSNSVIWTLLAVIHILLGFAVGIYFISGILYLIIGIRSWMYSKSVMQNPTGIVDKFRPVLGSVIVLVYSILSLSWLAIIGSVYYLAKVRKYVMSKEDSFKSLEANHII